MDAVRWGQIQNLFHEAADLPPEEQARFLTTACGNDQELLAEVSAMLEQDAGTSSLLDRNLAELAQQTFDAASLPTSPLQQFGPYRILRVLGEGGSGVVYLAERPDLGNKVAIKVLRDAWLSPARRERFASEQRTLAQLNHPSIAQIYDADVLPDGTPWFAMEHVEGMRLTDYCRTYQCSIEERLQLFRSVCEAVQYAHSHAVIHRDLKPSNILVKSDTAVRLLDFGIAKQLEDIDTPVEQTMTGLRLLTPAYAAPEQIRGDRVGISTDVYSLGVILYELLTGHIPFDLSNLTPSEAATVITEHEPEKPSLAVMADGVGQSSENNSAWADLDVLCLTAMHKDVGRRYRSVEALMRDIDHYLNAEPLEARPDSLRYRVGKFMRRNQRGVAIAAMVLATVVGLVSFFTFRLATAKNEALAEAARTERIQQFMTNLFQGGDEAAGPSDSLKVVTLLDRGVQEAKTLNGDPKIQAELYQSLGAIYQKLGKFDKADSLLRSALEQQKRYAGEGTPEVAASLVALGNLREAQAQFDEAERLVRQGLGIEKRKLPSGHRSIAKATLILGKVLEGRGRYQQAIPVLEEAVRLESQPGVPPQDLAGSLSELANTEFYAGNLAQSESLNHRVLAIQREVYGDRHPLVADTLINLAEIQFQRGQYVEAEHLNRQALDIVQSWYGKDHPETADTMTIVGQSLTYQGRFEEAAVLLQQSLAILEHVYGPVHPRVAYALNELGQVAIREGKLDEAARDFSREVDIYRTVYHDKHYLISIALSNLAGVYAQQRQYARAEMLFRDALQRYESTLAPNHLNVGIGHVRLGNTLLAERRYADAETESHAGYDILIQQNSPTLKWLQMARKDLGDEYEALKQPDQAARYRAELKDPASAQQLAKKN